MQIRVNLDRPLNAYVYCTYHDCRVNYSAIGNDMLDMSGSYCQKLMNSMVYNRGTLLMEDAPAFYAEKEKCDKSWRLVIEDKESQ